MSGPPPWSDVSDFDSSSGEQTLIVGSELNPPFGGCDFTGMCSTLSKGGRLSVNAADALHGCYCDPHSFELGDTSAEQSAGPTSAAFRL